MKRSLKGSQRTEILCVLGQTAECLLLCLYPGAQLALESAPCPCGWQASSTYMLALCELSPKWTRLYALQFGSHLLPQCVCLLVHPIESCIWGINALHGTSLVLSPIL